MRHSAQVFHRVALGLDGIVRGRRALDEDLLRLKLKRLLCLGRQDERAGHDDGRADVQLGNLGEIRKLRTVDDLHLREKCAVGQVDKAEVLARAQIAHPAADLDLLACVGFSLFKQGTDGNKLFHDIQILSIDIFTILQQQDAGLAAGRLRGLVPEARLHLADVARADHEHTQTALADAAAHGEGQLAV